MREAGLKPEFIYYPLSERQRPVARQLIQDYIREYGRPEAIFCHSGDIALGIHRGLGKTISMTEENKSIIVAAVLGGSMFAAVTAGFFADVLGRRLARCPPSETSWKSVLRLSSSLLKQQYWARRRDHVHLSASQNQVFTAAVDKRF